MPIFEYKCAKCQTVSEFLESGSAKKKHVCQKCGSEKMEKIFSTFAVGIAQAGADSKCQSCTDRGCPYAN